MTSSELGDDDFAWNFHNFNRDNAISDAKLESNWPENLRLCATDPDLLGDLQSGLSAQTVLTILGQKPVVVKTPSVRTLAKSIDLKLLAIHLRACLIQALAEETRELIPAKHP